MVKVKKVLSTVGTDKPSKQTFFRVRDGDEYTATVGILKHEEEGKIGKRTYLVLPQMFEDDVLEDVLTYAQIFLCQTKQGAYHLWSVSLPKDGADMSEWSATALEHIEVAKTRWIRIGRNKESNGYARTEAETPFPDPTWEDLPLTEFMRIAFKGEGVIASPDHPVVRKLRGAD